MSFQSIWHNIISIRINNYITFIILTYIMFTLKMMEMKSFKNI